MSRILVVDDEEDIRALLRSTLEFAEYEVTEASDAVTALDLLRQLSVDMVILDVMMPGLDGFELIRLLRSRDTTMPVLFLSARHEVEDRVRGLRLGADDYVTKPFSVAEVVARVDALLRRSRSEGSPEDDIDGLLRLDDLVVDTVGMSVSRSERPISLSPTEFRLLAHLVANRGRVLSKSQLLHHVWGYDFGGDTNVVERFVSNLRRKVDDGSDTPLLHTVRGFGYTARVGGR